MPFYSATNAADIFAIVSNFALLIPCVMAWHRYSLVPYTGYIVISVTFFFETWTSSLFHLCKAFDVCPLSYWTLRQFDFFFATSLLWLSAALLVILEGPYARRIEVAIQSAGLVTAAFVQAATKAESVTSIFSYVAIGMVVIYIIVYRCVNLKWPPYNMYYLCLAIELFALSTNMYLVQNYWPGAYWIIHATWHVLAAAGWVCLLSVREPSSSYETIGGRYIFAVSRIKGN